MSMNSSPSSPNLTEDLCTWAVRRIIEIAERRKRKMSAARKTHQFDRPGAVGVGLAGCCRLALGRSFPGQPVEAIAQVYAARDRSLAVTNLALIAGFVLCVIVVIGTSRVLTRFTRAITMRARHRILGDKTKRVVVDAAIEHPELAAQLDGMGSKLAAFLPWLAFLMLAGAEFLLKIDITSFLMAVVMGIVLFFPQFLTFRLQTRLFRENLGPWAERSRRGGRHSMSLTPLWRLRPSFSSWPFSFQW